MEIDESHILRSSGTAIWVFGLYDRGTKEVRLCVVGNDRSRNNLLPIIQRHVFTNEHMDSDDNDYRTRIYSDGWGAYTTNEIEEMGFLHRRVVHENRRGSFHTNSIESYWSRFKHCTHWLNGVHSDEDIESIKDWVAYGYWFTKVSLRSKNDRIISLFDLLG